MSIIELFPVSTWTPSASSTFEILGTLQSRRVPSSAHPSKLDLTRGGLRTGRPVELSPASPFFIPQVTSVNLH